MSNNSAALTCPVSLTRSPLIKHSKNCYSKSIKSILVSLAYDYISHLGTLTKQSVSIPKLSFKFVHDNTDIHKLLVTTIEFLVLK